RHRVVRERGAPGPRLDVRQVQPVALTLHPHDDVADAAPVVSPAMEELELRHAWLEGEEAEGGDERRAAGRVLHAVNDRASRRPATTCSISAACCRRTGISAQISVFRPGMAVATRCTDGIYVSVSTLQEVLMITRLLLALTAVVAFA